MRMSYAIKCIQEKNSVGMLIWWNRAGKREWAVQMHSTASRCPIQHFHVLVKNLIIRSDAFASLSFVRISLSPSLYLALSLSRYLAVSLISVSFTFFGLCVRWLLYCCKCSTLFISLLIYKFFFMFHEPTYPQLKISMYKNDHNNNNMVKGYLSDLCIIITQ